MGTGIGRISVLAPALINRRGAAGRARRPIPHEHRRPIFGQVLGAGFAGERD